MAQATPVADGMYRIDTVVNGTEMPLSLYLVAGREWLATDTGCVDTIGRVVRPALAELMPGARIGRGVICHAHADHFGGSDELQGLYPGCEIMVHRDDAAWVRDPAWHLREAYDWLGTDFPCPEPVRAWVGGLLGPGVSASRLEAGDRLPLDDGTHLSVIDVRGHSPGHIALWEPQRRVLLASDAILGAGQQVGGRVVAIPSYLDLDDYLNAVRAIGWLRPEILCTAHFGVLRGAEVADFCAASADFVQRLEVAVQEVLHAAGPLALQPLTARVLPLVAPGVDPSVVAAFSVQAHLNWLERHGLAAWELSEGERVWRTS